MKKSAKYSEEFKEEAVRLMLEQGKPANELSKEVGVPQTTLFRWLREHRAEHSPKKRASKTVDQRELERLRKENHRGCREFGVWRAAS